jgi:hypothetical protein
VFQVSRAIGNAGILDIAVSRITQALARFRLADAMLLRVAGVRVAGVGQHVWVQDVWIGGFLVCHIAVRGLDIRGIVCCDIQARTFVFPAIVADEFFLPTLFPGDVLCAGVGLDVFVHDVQGDVSPLVFRRPQVSHFLACAERTGQEHDNRTHHQPVAEQHVESTSHLLASLSPYAPNRAD